MDEMLKKLSFADRRWVLYDAKRGPLTLEPTSEETKVPPLSSLRRVGQVGVLVSAGPARKQYLREYEVYFDPEIKKMWARITIPQYAEDTLGFGPKEFKG
jgi:hypothetical protein